jgi:hypothetical protein
MDAKTKIADSLKATIEKAERYVLLGLSSAAVFLALSLAEPKSGDVVEWELLGFPLSIEPPLALVLLYLLYVFSGILADNLFIHARNLAEKLDVVKTGIVLSHPSILTVSPIFSFVGTVVPGVLVTIGIWLIQGDYSLHSMVWWILSGYALVFSIFLYLHFWRYIRPYLPKSEASKADDEKA